MSTTKCTKHDYQAVSDAMKRCKACNKPKVVWDRILWHMKDINNRAPVKVILRLLFYALIEAVGYPKTDSAYKQLSAHKCRWQEQGKLGWHFIPEEERQTSLASDNSYTAETSAKDLRESIVFRVASNLQDYFQAAYWEKQPKYVEIWVEDVGMSKVIDSVAKKHKVTVQACKGYSSRVRLKEGADRFKAIDDAREKVILYWGDFDPSGLDIERDIKEYLAKQFGVHVTMQRVALTKEQIVKYQFPGKPTKKKDVRTKGFIEKYGDKSVELAAIRMELIPGMVEDAILEHFDVDLYMQRQRIAERRTYGYRERAKLALKEVLEKSDELIEAIDAELEEAA